MNLLESLQLTPHTAVWLVPILIFVARILDVSLGTLRIILVARDKRALSSLLGFLEVLIWLAAISQIISNLTTFTNYIAYAAGFAAGTYVGMTIERRIAIGTLLVRIILTREAKRLREELDNLGYRYTCVPAEGAKGPVTILFMVVARAELKKLRILLDRVEPDAFFTVEDVRLAEISRTSVQNVKRRSLWGPFLWFRKSK